MKGRIKTILLASAICLAIPLRTRADVHYELNTLYQVEVTAYCETGTTSSGYVIPADGSGKKVCAFGKEYEGCTITVYYDNELVGIYECLDTGSNWAGIATSETLDINIPNDLEACKEWGRRTCTIYITRGVG